MRVSGLAVLLWLSACGPAWTPTFTAPGNPHNTLPSYDNPYPECDDSVENGLVTQLGCAPRCLPLTTINLICTDNGLPAMLPTPAQQLTYAKSRYPIDPTCPNGWTIYRTADAQAQKPQSYFSDMSYSWGYLLDDVRPQCIIDEAQTGGSDAGYFGRNAGAFTFFFVYVPALNE